MTDRETIDHVLRLFGMPSGEWAVLKRNQRALLVLPRGKQEALHAMRLYQPQRFLARGMMMLMRWAARLGLHRFMLPTFRYHQPDAANRAPLADVNAEAVGILMGSPEHRIQRAIVSYRHKGRWEVAKVAFGAEGSENLQREAEALTELGSISHGVPQLLGLHESSEASVLRIPYLTGKIIAPGESADALALLEHWISNEAPKAIVDFTEWPHIKAALSVLKNGQRMLDRLALLHLHPVVCHGDFARWNLLRQDDGKTVVLDWEWGHKGGMPGIDLVHYFLQDHRLVKRLPPIEAIKATLADLKQDACMSYLKKTGWDTEPILPIIASLAYKQGAKHQANEEILEDAVNHFEELAS